MSHGGPIENIPGTILDFVLPGPALDHSLDKPVDVFASVTKLSAISCCSPRASFEAASWRMKSESWFHPGKPEVLDTDLSGDNRSCKLCDIFFLEEDFREFIVEFLVSLSLSSLPQEALQHLWVNLAPSDQVLRGPQHT